MDCRIIYKADVDCKHFGTTVMLSLCRYCPSYRHETVDGYVMCNWVKKE